MEKVTDEIKNVVQRLLDDDENFSGWYIEKELEKIGIKVSEMDFTKLTHAIEIRRSLFSNHQISSEDCLESRLLTDIFAKIKKGFQHQQL